MINLRNLNEIECFLAVAEFSSFVLAAKHLHISKNSVSRFVSNFEDKIGEKLFRRTTRTVYLTSFGEITLKKCQLFWENLNKLEHDLDSSKKEPSGTLRILASDSFSEIFLYEHLKIFQAKYPKIKTEITFSEHEFWNLEAQDINILFAFPHITDLTDTWRSRQIGNVQQQLIASPKLLKQFGPINSTADLLKVPFLNHVARVPKNAFLLNDNSRVPHQAPTVIASSFNHLNKLCKLGIGIALSARELVQKELKSGELIKILPDLNYKKFEMRVFYRPEEYALPKVRAFLELFKATKFLN